MRISWFLALGLAVSRTLLFGAGADTRFSQSIGPEERQAIGLGKLNSDELAILDALVRRDITDRMFSPPEPGTPTEFTKKLTADEQKNTGVARMTTEERAQLDATIAKIVVGGQTQTLMTPPIFLPRTSIVRNSEKKEKHGLETHGSISLSYGWGGGYTTRSGSMVVNMSDPDKKYSITIGYGETHVKGPDRPSVLLDSGPPYFGNPELLRP